MGSLNPYTLRIVTSPKITTSGHLSLILGLMGCVQTTYYGTVHVLKGFWAEDGNESFTLLVMPWCQTKNTFYCQQREVGATYSICSYSRWKECVSLFLSVDSIDSWALMALGSREFDSLLAFLMSHVTVVAATGYL